MINPGENYHYMQAHLFEGKYVFLSWPKNCTLEWLNFAKDIVNLQLDSFRKLAAIEEPAKEYARAEVESWSKA